jgi:TatD DNase family protein
MAASPGTGSGAPAFVDTHCHIDLYHDPRAVIREAEERQVLVIAVTNTPSVFDYLLGLIGESNHIHAALGLHPELAVERASELPLFSAKVKKARFIGEVGLDYTTSSELNRRTQRRVFTTILSECDAVGSRVLTVHSRRAADDVVDAIGPAFRGRFILHWYSGKLKTLQRAIEFGGYVSVNPAMIATNKAREWLLEIPRERVLTETDGPFVHVESERAEPHNVRLVVDWLASIWEISPEESRALVRSNFDSLLH